MTLMPRLENLLRSEAVKMQTPTQRIRALVDRMTKMAADRPALPTGKDGRTLDEAMNTGAVARNQAVMNTKKQDAGFRTVPLSCLQRKGK